MANADRKALEALLTRVEAATGADREIDAALSAIDPKWNGYAAVDFKNADRWVLIAEGDKPRMALPEYTASIDAALALVERVLPGADWSVGRMEQKGGAWVAGEQADAATPPLAILAALCRALLAQTEAAEHDR